jgi:hypothetical protein
VAEEAKTPAPTVKLAVHALPDPVSTLKAPVVVAPVKPTLLSANTIAKKVVRKK